MRPKYLLLTMALAVVLLMSASATMALERGDTAPPFIGNSTTGMVSLADFAGDQSVVLALYFAIFTPV